MEAKGGYPCRPMRFSVATRIVGYACLMVYSLQKLCRLTQYLPPTKVVLGTEPMYSRPLAYPTTNPCDRSI